MIVVKVTYTVKSGFVEQNKRNIEVFLNDFRELNNDDFRYTAYQVDGTNKFVHISHYKNGDIQKTLLNREPFLEFQKQRDESGLEGQPEIDVMTNVGTSRDIFS